MATTNGWQASKQAGALWRSAFVAALFAVHPLNVESVAWVVERKGVLSAFFGLLALWTYARYAQSPSPKRFVPVCIFFLLASMSKVTIVVLPCALLLLDYWPLGRMQNGECRMKNSRISAQSPEWNVQRSVMRLILEKWPLFALSAISSAQAIFHMKNTGGIRTTELVPVLSRVSNALVTYASCVLKTVYPHGLAAFYPHPCGTLPVWEVMGSALFILSISVLVILLLRCHPYLAVGWLWYLGMFVPMIGLIQVSEQATADRYTYLPAVGLFIMISWGGTAFVGQFAAANCRCWRLARATVAVVAVMMLLFLMSRAWIQVSFWRDSITLFEHTLRITRNNWPFHDNLGVALAERGNFDEAIQHFQEVIRLKPGYPDVHFNMGNALNAQGRTQEAMDHYAEFLRRTPRHAAPHHKALAHSNLADGLMRQGNTEEAVKHYREALRINPDLLNARRELADAFMRQGKHSESVEHYRRALQVAPASPEIHFEFGIALAMQNRMDEAIRHFRRALQIDPALTKVHNHLGNALTARLMFDEAVDQYQLALQANSSDVVARYNLGTCLARQGKISEAIECLEETLRQQPHFDWAQHALKDLRKRLDGKKVPGQQLHSTSPSNPASTAIDRKQAQ